jgi:hypothetical protein
MNRFGYGALILVTLIACFAFTSPAQARWAPSGPYAYTCRNIQFDGDTLTATCRRHDGGWRNTWLPNADNCDGNIANDNGQLECSDRGYWHDRGWDRVGRDTGPSGPYESTCTNIRMDGYTLKATCQRRDGSWRWSELEDAYDCDGRVRNYNGRLACGRRDGY